MLLEYNEIVKWTTSRSNHFKETALQEFLHADEADAWLVAYALKNKISLVTYEKSEPNSKRKVKIPDVCLYFKVPFLSPIAMFRELKQTF